MSEKTLAKAQVRKVATLVVWKAKAKDKSNLGEFERQLLREYPALKSPSQMKRVLEKAERIVEFEKARAEDTAVLIERILA
jgi:hypothetical protein